MCHAALIWSRMLLIRNWVQRHQVKGEPLKFRISQDSRIYFLSEHKPVLFKEQAILEMSRSFQQAHQKETDGPELTQRTYALLPTLPRRKPPSGIPSDMLNMRTLRLLRGIISHACLVPKYKRRILNGIVFFCYETGNAHVDACSLYYYYQLCRAAHCR